jgi:hypothetical protein
MTLEQITAARKEKAAAYAANRQARMAELKAKREASALQRALARAASNPQFNFTQRPEGLIDEKTGIIRYYGWNGGKTTGKWVLREAPLTDENLRKYQTRVPAMEYAVTDIKAVPLPVKDIYNRPQQPGGFTVDANGNIITRGNVDPNLLSIKSDYDAKRLESMRQDRESIALDRALKRAATNPIYNFMVRPQGYYNLDTIYFYSWVGSKDSGQWYKYEAKNTPENMAQYKTRIPGVEYYTPSSYRDVLIPKYNLLGEPQGSPIVVK